MIFDPHDGTVGRTSYNNAQNSGGRVHLLPRSLCKLIAGEPTIGFIHNGLEYVSSLGDSMLIGGGRRFGNASFISTLTNKRIMCVSPARPGKACVIEPAMYGNVINPSTTRPMQMFSAVVRSDGHYDHIDHKRTRWIPFYKNTGLRGGSRFITNVGSVKAIQEFQMAEYAALAGYKPQPMLTKYLDLSKLGADPNRWWWAVTVSGISPNDYCRVSDQLIDRPARYADAIAGVGPRSTTRKERDLIAYYEGPGGRPSSGSIRQSWLHHPQACGRPSR